MFLSATQYNFAFSPSSREQWRTPCTVLPPPPLPRLSLPCSSCFLSIIIYYCTSQPLSLLSLSFSLTSFLNSFFFSRIDKHAIDLTLSEYPSVVCTRGFGNARHYSPYIGFADFYAARVMHPPQPPRAATTPRSRSLRDTDVNPSQLSLRGDVACGKRPIMVFRLAPRLMRRDSHSHARDVFRIRRRRRRAWHFHRFLCI